MNALKRLNIVFLFLNIIAITSSLIAMDEDAAIIEINTAKAPLLSNHELELDIANQIILTNDNGYQIIVDKKLISNVVDILKNELKAQETCKNNNDTIIIKLPNLSSKQLNLLADCLEEFSIRIQNAYEAGNFKPDRMFKAICKVLENKTLAYENDMKPLAYPLLLAIEKYQIQNDGSVSISKNDVVEHLNKKFESDFRDVDKSNALIMTLLLPLIIWAFLKTTMACQEGLSPKSFFCLMSPFFGISTVAFILYLLNDTITVLNNKKTNRIIKKAWPSKLINNNL